MAKKSSSQNDFVLYDVIYEDDSQRSNRKVPAHVLQEHKPEDAVRAEIAAQDRAISEKSGKPPMAIKSVKRSGKK